jgi:ABC-type amino acid transport substrate-binding protein
VGEDLNAGWPGAVRAEIEADVRRVAERLRTLSVAQLAAAAPPYASRAAGGRTVAQSLADAAQALEERESGVEPRWRDVPALSDLAVGDQVALTGQDLLTALDSGGPDETVWVRGTRRTSGEVVADAAAQLAALRRAL